MTRRKETENCLTPDRSPKEPRFIADAMLGRLARWLRFLGFDTFYDSDITDSSVIRIAREQDRFILTRDTRLIKVRALKDYLLVHANDTHQQLLEVIDALKLKDFRPLSRCVACNGRLKKIIGKSEVKDSVPEYVFLHYHDFLKCSDCGRIYWEGSHPKHFREKIDDILKNSKISVKGEHN